MNTGPVGVPADETNYANFGFGRVRGFCPARGRRWQFLLLDHAFIIAVLTTTQFALPPRLHVVTAARFLDLALVVYCHFLPSACTIIKVMGTRTFQFHGNMISL
jgi:hypothetical protein